MVKASVFISFDSLRTLNSQEAGTDTESGLGKSTPDYLVNWKRERPEGGGLEGIGHYGARNTKTGPRAVAFHDKGATPCINARAAKARNSDARFFREAESQQGDVSANGSASQQAAMALIPQGIDMAVPLHENAGAQSIREVQMSILNTNLTVLRFGGLALFGASRLSTPKRRIVTFLGGILMAYIPWIIGLTRRREVLQMAEITGHDRRFLAACCMEMWEWLDVEGVTDEALHRNVTGVTLTALRMIVDVAGFVDAMIAVGWIKQGPSCDHFIFPSVKEHGLSSSKERSSNAERQARFREKQKNRNAKSVTFGVTSNVTSNGIRGEERRIKKSKGETPIPLEVPPSLQISGFPEDLGGMAGPPEGDSKTVAADFRREDSRQAG